MNALEHYQAGEDWLEKAENISDDGFRADAIGYAQAHFAAAAAWVEMSRFERECNPVIQHQVVGSSEEILSWSTK